MLASTDRFLLAAFLDEAAVGAYHAGYSLANRTLDVLFIWLGAAGGPALVMALERGGREALKVAAREQAAIFALVALPAAAGLALVARPLAEVMIGEQLRDLAAAITPWIALAALLAGITTYYFHQAFTLGRRTGWLLGAMAVPAGANVVLNLLLIPSFGVMGAAWATTTGTHGHQPAFPTTVVDTTAAGDAFVGGIAARLAAGERDLAQAVRFAGAAGSLATARSGAQPSLPSLSQVLDLLG